MIDLLKTLRFKHWIKNLIIILPLFFSGKLFYSSIYTWETLIKTIVSFCLSSTMIYIINDLTDIESDQKHPVKSNRPIASGLVSYRKAIITLIFISLLNCLVLFFLPLDVTYYILAYIFLNLIYCFGLKNVAILDVSSISLGFVFRIMAGGEASNTLITHWIIILVFLLMFSIALAKRRDDLVLLENNQGFYRKSQSGYNVQFIDLAKTISFTVTLVAYIIYSVSTDVINRLGSKYVFVTSLPVFIGVIRYLQLTIVYKKSGDPVEIALKDKFLIFTLISWILLFTLILYV